MTDPQLFTIIGSVLGVGFALAVMAMRITARLDRRIDDASADRRAFQAAMDDFRKEMQRLAERQSHVEGTRTAGGG